MESHLLTWWPSSLLLVCHTGAGFHLSQWPCGHWDFIFEVIIAWNSNFSCVTSSAICQKKSGNFGKKVAVLASTLPVISLRSPVCTVQVPTNSEMACHQCVFFTILPKAEQWKGSRCIAVRAAKCNGVDGSLLRWWRKKRQARCGNALFFIDFIFKKSTAKHFLYPFACFYVNGFSSRDPTVSILASKQSYKNIATHWKKHLNHPQKHKYNKILRNLVNYIKLDIDKWILNQDTECTGTLSKEVWMRNFRVTEF